MKKIRVVELFAGVGGFHVGFDRANENLGFHQDNGFKVVWANQWEPSTKKQHAFDVYKHHFPESVKEFSNYDIHRVVEEHFSNIPKHDFLVGGFPCQDYSVARTLNQAKGLEGKKGVLWWDIRAILEKFNNDRPDYLMLENVDRLLKSPAKQRGRDFAIMLASLSDLGYAVEWRVVNAADYGMPQRRRRTYILGYKKGSRLYTRSSSAEPRNWLENDGIFAKAFPVNLIHNNKITTFSIEGDLEKVTRTFNLNGGKSLFDTSGLMVDRKVTTTKIIPRYASKTMVMRDILDPEDSIPIEYYLNSADLERWKYLKGAKHESRRSKSGFEYNYTEGPMIFPDKLDQPSRTIVTGEGGSSPSRFKHVIETDSGRLRRLTPDELEALDMFPKGHTLMEPSPIRRAFFMGNALVVGIVTKLGEELLKEINLIVPEQSSPAPLESLG